MKHFLIIATCLLTVVGCRANPSKLQLAAGRGDEAEVRGLLDSGIPADEMGRSRGTPLFWALSDHHFRVADLLARRGADPRFEDDREDSLAQSFREDRQVVLWLTKHGVSVPQTDGIYRSKSFGSLRISHGFYDSEMLTYGECVLRGDLVVLEPQEDSPSLVELQESRPGNLPPRLPFTWNSGALTSVRGETITFQRIPDPGGKLLAQSLKAHPLKKGFF